MLVELLSDVGTSAASSSVRWVVGEGRGNCNSLLSRCSIVYTIHVHVHSFFARVGIPENGYYRGKKTTLPLPFLENHIQSKKSMFTDLCGKGGFGNSHFLLQGFYTSPYVQYCRSVACVGFVGLRRGGGKFNIPLSRCSVVSIVYHIMSESYTQHRHQFFAREVAKKTVYNEKKTYFDISRNHLHVV